MGKIEDVVKSEIVRLAKKELRATLGPLARDVRQLKRSVSQLQKTVRSLERVGKGWAEQVRTQKAALQAPEAEVKTARFSPRLMRTLRKRLGISQAELGKLVGVSTVTVGTWEQGKARPSETYRSTLVALRKMGRRDVREVLELKVAAQPTKPRKVAKRKAKKKK